MVSCTEHFNCAVRVKAQCNNNINIMKHNNIIEHTAICDHGQRESDLFTMKERKDNSGDVLN